MLHNHKYFLLLLFTLFGVLLNSFPVVAEKKTYEYKIKGNDEPVLLTEEGEEGDSDGRTYRFSSLTHYYLRMESQEGVSYNNCNCDDCSHEASSSSQSQGHRTSCPAHSIFSYRFSVDRTGNTEANADPERNNAEGGKTMAMNLNDILRPLIEYFKSHRGSRKITEYFFEDSRQRTLERLRVSTSTCFPNCRKTVCQSCQSHFLPTAAYFSKRMAVFIPPAVLINSPDSETPDISPLAYILNPDSTSDGQGYPEEISFELLFLRMDDAQSSREVEDGIVGNYRINLFDGQFRLTIPRENASDFEVTGNIFPEPFERPRFERRPLGGPPRRRMDSMFIPSMDPPEGPRFGGYHSHIMRRGESMTEEERRQFRLLPKADAPEVPIESATLPDPDEGSNSGIMVYEATVILLFLILTFSEWADI
ncbi:hypothetical protein NX722_14655 [Endozoicomonas gorgoniicola]|uniref:Uncharacterized protein n=1 Tax=Endozoicomonas gorgoniicola TaxID=1234144 RepID=A0ABT3MXP3_9GAMM|nr:hypothetical protein [Endozoicomonas gorgoniicola]MCW7553843.1 hypothetical protein [Endozoicomonas gorgoniicola]